MSITIEISVVVDTEAAGNCERTLQPQRRAATNNEAGEAGGGEAVIEGTGFDDVDVYSGDPMDLAQRLTVRPTSSPVAADRKASARLKKASGA
ncbi:MAG: hypothetical protein R2838_24790 [Caldilineaceae bacterium]